MFRDQGLKFRVHGAEFRVQSLGFSGLGFGVEG